MTFETKYAQLGKRVKVSAHRRSADVQAHSRRWPGGRSRQLSFAGPSVASAGRVVIYRPQGLGKPIKMGIPVGDIDNDIRIALEDHFKDYGGYDSYGKAPADYSAFAYPSDGAFSARLGVARHGELLGTYGDFHRFDGPQPAWVKKGQITEVGQQEVDNKIKKVVHDAIVAWLAANKGVKLESIMNNIIGVTVAIGTTVKRAINTDPWFQAFGLKVA